MKQKIFRIAPIAITILSIYFIIQFFKDYNLIFLVAGILIPIITGFLSSQYCANNTFSIVLILFGILGFYYYDNPLDIVILSISIYMILFKMSRFYFGLTGDHLGETEIYRNSIKFLTKLLNSDWYIENKSKQGYEIDINTLLKQSFHQEYVRKNIQEFSNILLSSRVKNIYSTEDLLRLHAIATIHTLKTPIIYTKDGISSVGNQMLLNVFSNLKSPLSLPGLSKEKYNDNLISYIKNDNLNIRAAMNLVENSINKFGEVSIDTYNKVIELK